MLTVPAAHALGPATVATTWWRWRGQLHLSVVVKASFSMHQASRMRRAAPVAVRLSEQQPYLSQADLLFTGEACMPKPVSEVAVRFGVFRHKPLLDKSVGLREQTPFSRQTVSALGPTHAPALENELADDLAWDHFQVAPPDQRSDYLHGDEWVLLEGLSPNVITLSSRMPNAKGQARVRFGDGPTTMIAMWCDTLHVDGDQERCTLLWRGNVSITSEEQLSSAQVWAGVSSMGAPIDWPAEASLPDDGEAFDEDQLETVPLSERLSPDDVPPAPRSSHHAIMLGDALDADDPLPPSTPAPSSTPAPKSSQRTVLLSDLMDEEPEAANAAPSDPGFTATMSEAAQAQAAAASPTPFDGASDGASDDAKHAPASGSSAPASSTGTVNLSDSLAEHAARQAAVPFPTKSEAPASASKEPAPPPPPPRIQGTVPIAMEGSPWAQSPPNLSPRALGDGQISHHFGPDAHPRHTDQDLPPTASALFDDRPHAGGSAAAIVPPARTTPALPIRQSTPLSVVALKGSLRPPTVCFTVVAKATCDLSNEGEATLCDTCEPATGDQPATPLLNEPGLVTYPSDLAPFKPKADVILCGSAYSRPDAPNAGHVRFCFGEGNNRFDRRAAIFGTRHWEYGAMTEPEPFERLALTWEHAFGGKDDPRNPAGKGKHASTEGQLELPQIEHANAPVSRPAQTPEPMGFGPVPTTWAARWKHLGTYDQSWFQRRWPYHPENFDWHFHQAAPPEQQLEHLSGDEPFRIEGVRPDSPVIEGRLPGIKPRVFALRHDEGSGHLTELPMHLDTVVFDTDAMKLHLVWRGAIEVTDWDGTELSTLFAMHDSLNQPSTPLERIRGMLAAQLTPLEPITQEPSENAAAANDTGPDVATDEEPKTPATAAPTLDADAFTKEYSSAVESELNRAREQAGLAPLKLSDVKPAPTPRPREFGDMLREAGLGGTPLAALAAAATAGHGSPPNRDMFATLMSSAGVPQHEIDKHLAGFPQPETLPGPETLPQPDLPPAPDPAPDAAPPLSAGERLRQALEEGESLESIKLFGEDLSGLDFTGQSFKGATLKQCNLSSCTFDECDLSGAQLSESTLTGSSFRKATLEGADLTRCEASSANFEEANIERASFDGLDARDALFDKSRGAKASFENARLDRARFNDAVLPRLNLTGASIEETSFEGAQLQRICLHNTSGSQANFAGACLADARADGAALANARFDEAQAPGSVWESASLRGANFDRSCFDAASFVRASLEGATFLSARMREARFDGARLEGATMLKADLMEASLDGANVRGANLQGANLYAASSWRADTKGAEFDQALRAKTRLGEAP